MIQPDSEEEEELPEGPSKMDGASGPEDSAAEKSVQDSPEKVETKAPKKEEKKGAKKDDKKGAKNVVEEPPKEEINENKKPDPNFNKFCPDVIRLSGPYCNHINHFQQIMNYSFTLKPEESFCLVIEDNQIDSLQTNIVDFTFGALSVSGSGGVRYLSLSGMYKAEKSAKVQRYIDLIKHMAHSINR